MLNECWSLKYPGDLKLKASEEVKDVTFPMIFIHLFRPEMPKLGPEGQSWPMINFDLASHPKSQEWEKHAIDASYYIYIIYFLYICFIYFLQISKCRLIYLLLKIL